VRFEPVTSYQLPVTGSAPFFFLVPWELGILERTTVGNSLWGISGYVDVVFCCGVEVACRRRNETERLLRTPCAGASSCCRGLLSFSVEARGCRVISKISRPSLRRRTRKLQRVNPTVKRGKHGKRREPTCYEDTRPVAGADQDPPVRHAPPRGVPPPG
jgi:hypothetical protein